MCKRLEATFNCHEIVNSPIGSKVYYKIQEELEQYADKFASVADGGVRSTSTLPPKLNAFARLLACTYLIEDFEDTEETVEFRYECSKVLAESARGSLEILNYIFIQVTRMYPEYEEYWNTWEDFLKNPKGLV